MPLPFTRQAQRGAYALGYLWLRARSGISQEEVVFILGAPRSGTTLLQDRVSRHSRLFSVKAETGFFARDNVWRRAHNWTDLRGDAMRRTRGGDLVSQFSSFVAAARDLTDAGDRVFVEKTPQHVLQLAFLVTAFPQARFLHIVRDPRACYASSKSHANIAQKTTGSFARYWTKCIKARLAVQDARIMDIAYDELVSQPEPVMHDIMEFLGLALEPAQIGGNAGSDDKRAERKAFAKLAEPINATSIDKWRQTLSRSEIETIENYTGSFIAGCQSNTAFQALLRPHGSS